MPKVKKTEKAVPITGTASGSDTKLSNYVLAHATLSADQFLLRHFILVSIRTDTVTFWKVSVAPAH